MSGIAAQDVHSNPLGTLERLLYTHQGILEPDVRPQGLKHSKAEEVLELALNRKKDKHFTGPLEKYYRYTQSFWGSLDKLTFDDIMFLDPFAPVLESPLGVQRAGIDDFATMTDFAPKITWLHEQYSPETREGLERWIFWRMGIYDLPWKVQEKGIEHALPKIVPAVNRTVDWGGGKGLAHWRRDKEAMAQDPTAKLGSVALSTRSLQQLMRVPAYVRGETQRHSARYGTKTEEEFVETQDAAIRLTRELLRRKYSILLDRLGIERPWAYMLEGDVGMELLPRPRTEIRVPGRKLLSGLSKKGPLDPQALNRLSGHFTALYGGHPVIFPSSESQENVVVQSRRWPWLRTLKHSAELEHAIGAVPTRELHEMVEDLTRFAAGLDTIEAVTFRLAYGNEPVHRDGETTQWRDATGGKKIRPWDVSGLRAERFRRDVRPSNTGATRCVMQAWLNMRPEQSEFDPGMEARVGSLGHDIRNSLASKEYEVLRTVGVIGLARERYCEIPITQEIIPDKDDWERAEDFIHREHGRRDKLWQPLLGSLQQARQRGSFFDGGKPDAVLALDDGTPVIVDFKRRRAQYYPTPYFFFQMGRYARMLLDLSERTSDQFFTVVAQRPYAPAIQEGEEFIDTGIYRPHKLRIKQFDRGSESWHAIRTIQIYELIRKDLFDEREDLRWYVREQQRDKNCVGCFLNTQTQPLCRTVLEGERKPWLTPDQSSA